MRVPVALALALALALAAEPSYRNMCFTNSCQAPVRVDYVGGATNYTCGDCPTGTLCSPINGTMPILQRIV